MNDSGEGTAKPWYWWILAVIAAVTGGKVAYDKKKKAMQEAKTVAEDVTEDEEK